jgi:histidine ammonia-lyase
LLNETVLLGAARLDAQTVRRIAADRVRVSLDPAAMEQVASNRAALEAAMERGDAIYGVTTGLGALEREHVSLPEAFAAQRAVLRSHAAGVGAPLSREVVRAAISIRVQGLLRGYSGIRPLVLERIADLLNADLVPVVPRTGSLGASGDLAPSAHAFLPLIGEGELEDADGRRASAADLLAEHGLEPLALAPKEALALINGTHFMAAIGALVCLQARNLLDAADAIAALSLEALYGQPGAFEARVHVLRELDGQATTAENVRAMVAGSERIGASNGSVQDAYSLRCIPQVHGAAREAMAFFSRLVEVDLNAVTDNPLVFDDPLVVISAGNFHGQSLALAFDTLRLALADLGSISERRSFRLVSPSLNGDLPAFLSRNAGAGTGYMVAHYTGAALLADLRALASPVSADNVPTSDNQEDHVSMGMTAALLAIASCDALATLFAVEALCAAQAVDLSEGRLGDGSGRLFALIREHVPTLVEDRPPANDITAVAGLITSGGVAAVLANPTGVTAR